MDQGQTSRFSMAQSRKEESKHIMKQVLTSLEQRGYDPVSQVVGYFLSNDPTYITNFKNARGIIRRMERDELLEEILREYFENILKRDSDATELNEY